MALTQTTNLLRQAVSIPHAGAGVLVAMEFYADLSGGLLAADVLEMGVIPAGTRLHSATLITSGIGATATLDVGVLSGEFGDTENARTMAATGEILEGATKNVATRAEEGALYAIGVDDDTDRGIGLRISADEAAGADTYARLIVTYYKP